MREFVEAAFARVGVSLEWRGRGVEEKGFVAGVAGGGGGAGSGADGLEARVSVGDMVVAVDESRVPQRHTAMRGTRRHPRYFRPAEVEQLLGDPTKAREQLGWEPRVKFEGLVEMMVDADISCVPQRHGADARNATTVAAQKRELYLRDGGYEVKNYYE